MKRALVLGAIAAGLMSVGIGAQGRNFSGSWVVDLDKTVAVTGAFSAGGRGGGGGGARSGGGGDITAAAGAIGGGGGRGGGMRSGGDGSAVAGRGGAAPGVSFAFDASGVTIVNGGITTTYKADGSATNLDNAMRKATAKATWQGDKLNIETATETPNGLMVTFAIWYLEGDSLVRENKSTGPDGQEVVRKTYFKRS